MFTGWLSFSQENVNNWPIFRGKNDLSGSTVVDFPESISLAWNISTGVRTKSSPVFADGVIYFGNDKGTIYAIGDDGKVRWKYEAGSPVEAPPLVHGNNIYTGASDGVFHAVNKLTGKREWSYTTENQIVGSANIWLSGKMAGIIFGSYDYFLQCRSELR